MCRTCKWIQTPIINCRSEGCVTKESSRIAVPWAFHTLRNSKPSQKSSQFPYNLHTSPISITENEINVVISQVDIIDDECCECKAVSFKKCI